MTQNSLCTRRNFVRLMGSGVLVALSCKTIGLNYANAAPMDETIAGEAVSGVRKAAKERIPKISKSDEEWHKELTTQQYDVLREEGTERPFTSPLLKEHRDGVFACAGCGLPLFSSSAKYDSGTGWPSFFEAIDGHVETKTDHKLIVPRTEYHCARCDGHQGHVFNDGPEPTGLRYCNNGVALKFVPSDPINKDKG